MSNRLKSLITEITSKVGGWTEDEKTDLFYALLRKDRTVTNCFYGMCDQYQYDLVHKALAHVLYIRRYKDSDITEVNCTCGEECEKLWKYFSRSDK